MCFTTEDLNASKGKSNLPFSFVIDRKVIKLLSAEISFPHGSASFQQIHTGKIQVTNSLHWDQIYVKDVICSVSAAVVNLHRVFPEKTTAFRFFLDRKSCCKHGMRTYSNTQCTEKENRECTAGGLSAALCAIAL